MMTQKKYRYPSIFFLVVFFSLTACLEKIDLEVPAGFGDSIAIQARLLKGNPSRVDLRVSQLFDFTAASLRPINVRNPTLVDEEGNEVVLEELGLGNYVAFIDNKNPLRVQVGRSYKIVLSTFDNRRYESTFELLNKVPEPESLSVEFIETDVLTNENEYEKEQQLLFSVTTPAVTSDGNAGLLWEMERTYRVTDSPILFREEPKVCYITETVNKNDVKVLDPTDIISDRITDFPLFESPIDYRFAEGYFFTAIQYSLSPGAFEYWSNISELLQRTGNMFESPAGKISTNFRNVDDPLDEVFGYFYATESDTIRIGIDSTMVGIMPRFCPPDVPPPPGGGCPVLTCCNCLLEERSTTVKPSYWP